MAGRLRFFSCCYLFFSLWWDRMAEKTKQQKMEGIKPQRPFHFASPDAETYYTRHPMLFTPMVRVSSCADDYLRLFFRRRLCLFSGSFFFRLAVQNIANSFLNQIALLWRYTRVLRDAPSSIGSYNVVVRARARTSGRAAMWTVFTSFFFLFFFFFLQNIQKSRSGQHHPAPLAPSRRGLSGCLIRLSSGS